MHDSRIVTKASIPIRPSLQDRCLILGLASCRPRRRSVLRFLRTYSRICEDTEQAEGHFGRPALPPIAISTRGARPDLPARRSELTAYVSEDHETAATGLASRRCALGDRRTRHVFR